MKKNFGNFQGEKQIELVSFLFPSLKSRKMLDGEKYQEKNFLISLSKTSLFFVFIKFHRQNFF